MNDETYLENYEEGYRNGNFDKHYRGEMSIISSTWPEYSLPGYSKGYVEGYHSGYLAAFDLKGVKL